MQQFIAMLIAFALMPLWTKKKIPFGPTLLITGLILSLVAGLAPQTVLNSALAVVTTKTTVQTIAVVVMVGVLGALLKEYGILDIIVSSVETLIHSKKAIIMTLPAVMSLLSVPGGAHLSAPFVDTVGTELEIPPAKKAAINLGFRHFGMFVLPFGSSIMFLAATVPDFNLYKFIALNLPFVAVMELWCYWCYVRPGKSVRTAGGGDKKKAVLNLLLYLSPIYMVVVFNTILHLPMYISTALCIGIVFLIRPRKDFLQVAWKGVSFKTITMLMGVYFVQNLIKNLDQVMATFGDLFLNSSGFTVLLVVAFAAVLFGITTGLSLVPLGVLMPLMLSLSLSPSQILVYTFLIYSWSFIGYYFSPLHLCQLLTVKVMGCTTGDLYKEHAKLAPVLMLSSVALFYVYKTFLW